METYFIIPFAVAELGDNMHMHLAWLKESRAVGRCFPGTTWLT
jgi:hypothetical protein